MVVELHLNSFVICALSGRPQMLTHLYIRICIKATVCLQDGLFMTAFASPRGAMEWALLLQLALLR